MNSTTPAAISKAVEIDDLETGVEFTLDDLEIEQGALMPSSYRVPSINSKKHEAFAVEVGDEVSVFTDGKGKLYKEPVRAKRAFEDYINLGPSRSLDKLARLYSDPETEDWTDNYESVLRQLKSYSAKYDWQDRLRILLTRQAAQAVSAARTEQARSTRGRIALAKKLQDIGSQLIDKASDYLEASVDIMSPKEVNSMLKTAATMLDMGLAAERVEIGETMEGLLPPKPITAMDDDELAEFIDVLTSQIK